MKISKKTSILLGSAAIGALLLSGGAVVAKSLGAHGGGHGGGHEAHLSYLIGQVDQNSDGTLSAEEIERFRTDRFAAMDTDTDGELTPKEISEGMRLMRFQMMDTNEDGFVNEAEFLAATEHQKRAAKRIHRLDDDGNGRVAMAELTEMTDRMIAKLDRNEDGNIDAEELAKAKDHMRR